MGFVAAMRTMVFGSARPAMAFAATSPYSRRVCCAGLLRGICIPGRSGHRSRLVVATDDGGLCEPDIRRHAHIVVRPRHRRRAPLDLRLLQHSGTTADPAVAVLAARDAAWLRAGHGGRPARPQILPDSGDQRVERAGSRTAARPGARGIRLDVHGVRKGKVRPRVQNPLGHPGTASISARSSRNSGHFAFIAGAISAIRSIIRWFSNA